MNKITQNLAILLFLIILNNDLYAESRWRVIDSLEFFSSNGRGHQTRFIDIKSSNGKDIIAVANIDVQAPCMIKSDDGGLTWRITYLDTTNGYYHFSSVATQLAYPDTNLAIVACDSGYYYRSIDNGRKWSKYRFENKKRIHEVDFWDSKNGLLIQGNYNFNPLYYKTTDGGLNWYEIENSKPVGNYYPSDIHILPNGKCYSIELVDLETDSSFYIHKSTDYGETWSSYKSAKYPPTGAFFFVNENLGFCYGSGHINWDLPETKYIRKTTDGGRSWRVVLDTTYIPTNEVCFMHFYDTLNGMASTCGSIIRTTNGGDNWSVDTTYNRNNFKYAIYKLWMLDKEKAIGTSTWNWPHIFLFAPDSETTVDGYTTKYNINIYPNPSKNELRFTFADNIIFDNYEIFDVFGYRIISGDFDKYTDINKQYLDISNLSDGFYYIKLKSNTRTAYSKFIKN